MQSSIQKWQGKVAIVTGAGSGIGSAIAAQLVESGLEVVGVGRRKERIEQLAGELQGHQNSGKLYALKADISIEEDVLQIFEWIKDNLGPVHILINNAGIIRETNLTDGKTKLWREVIDINVLGLCIMTREAVKNMRENNVDGHIVHINSIFGHAIYSALDFNVYGASKHAVTALAETLRQEFNSIGSKIKITNISPGLVKTEILQASVLGKYSSGKDAEKEKYKYFNNAPILQTEDIADAVIYVLGTPYHVQIHEMIIQPLGQH